MNPAPAPIVAPASPVGTVPQRSWRRIALCLLGIFVLLFVWQLATYNLYSLPEQSYSAFTTITATVFAAIASIVVFMVTGQLIYEAKLNTAISVVTTSTAAVERKIEEIHADFQTAELKKRFGDK